MKKSLVIPYSIRNPESQSSSESPRAWSRLTRIVRRLAAERRRVQPLTQLEAKMLGRVTGASAGFGA
ncbi:MAG: hypothetical protein LBS70_02360, partial [Candidatus Accumulibacter sp.]|nr:hypothetical protein [Accumulibacter sp.]